MPASREIDSAAAAAKAAPVALCALAYEVISRQAEGKVLFAGEEFVRAKAAGHGIDLEDPAARSVDDRDIVALLERGPAGSADSALVMALAVQGLRVHLDDNERLERFAEHADWLSVCTDYPAYACALAVLGKEGEPLWRVVAAGVKAFGDDPRGVALTSMRRSVLQAAGMDEAAPEPASETSIRGRWRTPHRFRLLRWISGVALLQALGRAIGFLARVERTVEAKLIPRGVTLETQTRFLGRALRTHRAVCHAGSITRLETDVQHRGLALSLGAVAFALGVFAGAFALFDGLRTGETVLLIVGAGLVGSGALLDFVFSRLASFGKARGNLELEFETREPLRIEGVDEARAKEFAEALAQRLRA